MARHERACYGLNYNTDPNASTGKCKFSSDGYRLLAAPQAPSFMHGTKISQTLQPRFLKRIYLNVTRSSGTIRISCLDTHLFYLIGSVQTCMVFLKLMRTYCNSGDRGIVSSYGKLGNN
jgi:hypothetical protein